MHNANRVGLLYPKAHQHAPNVAKACIQILQLDFANHVKTHAIHQMQQAYTALEMVPLYAVDATLISSMGSQQSACLATKGVIH